LVFVLSVPFSFTTIDDLFGIYWSLYCLYLLDLRLLITPKTNRYQRGNQKS
jgi:hypothetical protein